VLTPVVEEWTQEPLRDQVLGYIFRVDNPNHSLSDPVVFASHKFEESVFAFPQESSALLLRMGYMGGAMTVL